MKRSDVVGVLVIALSLVGGGRRVHAQAPTIDTGAPPGPGSNASTLGPSPGANDSMLGPSPGSGGGAHGGEQGGILGGRVGPSVSRAPSSITRPSEGVFGIPPQRGIAAPEATPTPEYPLYGTLGEPLGPEDVGPPDGLTLDMAIDRLVKQSLDLLARSYEIPQAHADELTASLRANPVFYADAQLIPYGQYSNARPGGPLQFDINISYPLDVTHKRQARTLSAIRATRVLEAQYQDAVRLQIDNLYTAYVDVLAARQTLRYAETGLEGLKRVLEQLELRLQKGENILADVLRVKNNHDKAAIGLIDARANLHKKTLVLGTMLYYPSAEAAALQLRGSIKDNAPVPPPHDELIRIALNSRPDLMAYRLGIQRAEADVRLARASRLQDVYLLFQPYTFQNTVPFGTKSATSWALGVTVPLPIYNRNQGVIARAMLNVTQTQIQLAALERLVINDAEVADKEYATTREYVAEIEKKILPDARQVMTTARNQFQLGAVPLTTFLDAQRDFNDVAKVYNDTLVRHRRSMLDLNTAVGQRILP